MPDSGNTAPWLMSLSYQDRQLCFAVDRVGLKFLNLFNKQIVFILWWSKIMCGQQTRVPGPNKQGNVSDSSCSSWFFCNSADQMNFSNGFSQFICQGKGLEADFVMKKTCTNSKNVSTQTDFMCLNIFFHTVTICGSESDIFNYLYIAASLSSSQICSQFDASTAWDSLDHASFRSKCYLRHLQATNW